MANKTDPVPDSRELADLQRLLDQVERGDVYADWTPGGGIGDPKLHADLLRSQIDQLQKRIDNTKICNP